MKYGLESILILAACVNLVHAEPAGPLDKVYFRGLGCEWVPQAPAALEPWLTALKSRGFNMIQTSPVADNETMRQMIDACHASGITVFYYSRLPQAGKWLTMEESDWEVYYKQNARRVDLGVDGVIYDFATWENWPQQDCTTGYWSQAVARFNEDTDSDWTPEALAKILKDQAGRFEEGGTTIGRYNHWRCRYHADRARIVADKAAAYAAGKGRRFWVSFYLPDTTGLGADYRMLNEALPLLAPMIYGPVETRNPNRMEGDINHHIPAHPRHAKAIVCVEAGFPDTGGRKPLPVVMRAVWSTMLSTADGYALWHAAFASDEAEIAISNINKVHEWVLEPVLRKQPDAARRGLERWIDFLHDQLRMVTGDQMLRCHELTAKLAVMADRLDVEVQRPGQLDRDLLETLYRSAELAWEIQKADMVGKTQRIELAPFEILWREATGFLAVKSDALGMFLWQDSKAGNIDELRIDGLDKNVAANSRGDWGFCRQRGSLDEWGFRCLTRVIEHTEDLFVAESTLYYGHGLQTDRRLILHRDRPLIGVEFTITNNGDTERDVSPRLWNGLNLGPDQEVKISDEGANRVAVVTRDDFYAIMVVPQDSVDKTAWQGDRFDMAARWKLARGESRSLRYAFAIGRGGEAAVDAVMRACKEKEGE